MSKAIFAAALLVAHCSLIAGSPDLTVCYDGLGCFSTAEPFSAYGRVALLPDSPDDVDVKFLMYTPKNTDVHQELHAFDTAALLSSNFDGSKPSKFIVHGWMDSPRLGAWMEDMAKKFLKADDCNAFVVDWSGGGQKLYGQAVANTRVAGAVIAQFIQFLHDVTGSPFSKFHILGHSLGSHVAGYAGERIPGLGRITGLDPADPYFQNMSTVVRLDESDAQFVDIVHSDAAEITAILNPFNGQGGMGIMQPSGHVDVYPNGGAVQPGCGEHGPITEIIKDGLIEGVRTVVACAHFRSYEFAMETIESSCPWRAYSCSGGFDEFKTGRCLRCPTTGDKTKGCNGLGLRATQPSDGTVHNKYWLVTGDKSPFCRYHFHVQLKISTKDNKNQKGIAWVKLIGDGFSSDFLQLGEENFLMKVGESYDFLVTSPREFKAIKSVELKWEHDAHWYEANQWQFGKPGIHPESVAVFSGEHQTEFKFCNDVKDELKSKDSRILTKAC